MSTIRVRRVDAQTHEPSFGHGLQDYCIDVEATAQIIRTRLLLFQGEWWEDQSIGIPMWQEILDRPGDKIQTLNTERVLTAYIQESPHVRSVHNVSSSFDPETRQYEYSAKVLTDFDALIDIALNPKTPPWDKQEWHT